MTHDPDRDLTPGELEDLDDADAYNLDDSWIHDLDPYGDEDWIVEEDARFDLLSRMEENGDFI